MERRFDFINFFYGLGAAVILIAALFKFLGWKYSDVLFLIGLTGEALIFIISAFDWKIPHKRYAWERIFPELDQNSGDDGTATSIAKVGEQQQLQSIIGSVQSLNEAVSTLNEATKKLSDAVKKADANYDAMSESTKQYQEELERLRQKIASANDSLKELEKFNHLK